MDKISVVCNVPRNVLHFKFFPESHSFDHFPRPKSKCWSKQQQEMFFAHQKKCPPPSLQKSPLNILFHSEHLCLYKKEEFQFGKLYVFFKHLVLLGPLLVTVAKNAKHKTFLLGILTLCTFLGPQLNRLVLVWYLLNLLRARFSCGLHKRKYILNYLYNA